MYKPSRLKKTVFLLLLFLIAASALCLILDRAMPGKLRSLFSPISKRNAPNIVLIVIDTLRADHLSQYGYPLDTSPALDLFVSESILFENAYSTSSWTAPSTASLHSGFHPRRHGVTHPGDTLKEELVTIAEYLKHKAYETAGFSDNIHITRHTNFDQGFDTFFGVKKPSVSAYPDISKMMKKAKAWVQRHKNSSQPFFLYMQPMNCHGPYKVPKSHQKVLLSRRPSRRFKYYRAPMGDIMWHGKVERRNEVTAPYLKSLTEQYDTAVRYSTDQIADFLFFLDDVGLWDDTLMIVTADHGEELFDHGGFSHGYSLYNEVVRIPLIIKLPRQKTAGRESALVSLLDLYPTIVNALPGSKSSTTDGLSLLPFFEEENNRFKIDTGGSSSAFQHRALMLSLDWKSRGVMNGWVNHNHKYIDLEKDYSGKKAKKLLFNLISDPNEKQNIAKKQRKVTRRLDNALRKRQAVYSGKRQAKSENVIEGMNVEALKALGYIQN